LNAEGVRILRTNTHLNYDKVSFRQKLTGITPYLRVLVLVDVHELSLLGIQCCVRRRKRLPENFSPAQALW
jgi:hypothetical protein